MPLRVADSFVAIGSDFGQAVVYAADRGVDLISEALGALSSSAFDQAAIDYAYRKGIPMVASAADEESRHHNLPAALDHTIWVNSIVHEDGTIVEDRRLRPPERLHQLRRPRLGRDLLEQLQLRGDRPRRRASSRC